MNKIEELENKMLALVQEIAELNKSQNAGKSSNWKPKGGEQYFFASNAMNVIYDFMSNSRIDKERVKYSQIFKTEEECRKYCDYRKALSEKSYKFSREEWLDDSISKFCIVYKHDDKKYSISSWYSSCWIGMLHFKTEKDAQFMIDNYSEEMLKWGLL